MPSHYCYGTGPCFISSHLINHASPILSNELSNTYLISVWLLWNSSLFNFYILSLFGLVDIIIRFDSCLALLHTAYTQTLFLFSQTIFLLSYFLICSFFHTLSSYLLISGSSDNRIISYWRISGPYLIG